MKWLRVLGVSHMRDGPSIALQAFGRTAVLWETLDGGWRVGMPWQMTPSQRFPKRWEALEWLRAQDAILRLEWLE